MKETMQSWDGKRVVLGSGDTPSLSSSSGRDVSAAHGGEDLSYKDMVRRLLAGDADRDPELLRQAKALVEETPQEALQREQKELNQRRRELTYQAREAQEQVDHYGNQVHRLEESCPPHHQGGGDTIFRRGQTTSPATQSGQEGRCYGVQSTNVIFRRLGSRGHPTSIAPVGASEFDPDETEQPDHSTVGAVDTSYMSQIALPTAATHPGIEIPQVPPGLAMTTAAAECVDLATEDSLTEKEILDFVKWLPQPVIDGILAVIQNNPQPNVTATRLKSIIMEVQDNHRVKTAAAIGTAESSFAHLAKQSRQSRSEEEEEDTPQKNATRQESHARRLGVSSYVEIIWVDGREQVYPLETSFKAVPEGSNFDSERSNTLGVGRPFVSLRHREL